MRAGQVDGGQTGALVEDAGDRLPECEFALPRVPQSLLKAQRASYLEEQPDGAEGGPLLRREGNGLRNNLQAGEALFVAQGELDRFDLLDRAVREIGDGAMFDLPLVTERLPQQGAGIGGFAFADGGDVDVYSVHTMTLKYLQYKDIMPLL